MAEIKSLSTIANKWSKNSSSSEARESYKSGVTNPRRSWANSAAAADNARKEGLADADARDAYVRGVQDAGDGKWKSRAQSLGPSRFAQGVQVAEQDFSQGFAPYHSVIQGVTLPPRGPKGSPENLERVRAITEALHAAKVG